MTPKKEQIFRNALDLPPLERAVLVEELLSSFDREPCFTAEVEDAWVLDARDRMAAYQQGDISARSDDEVFLDINGGK